MTKAITAIGGVIITFLQLRCGRGAGPEAFAAKLEGLDIFGYPYLISIYDRPLGLQLMVNGASVLNSQGVRISHGPSFFDLE